MAQQGETEERRWWCHAAAAVGSRDSLSTDREVQHLWSEEMSGTRET